MTPTPPPSPSLQEWPDKLRLDMIHQFDLYGDYHLPLDCGIPVSHSMVEVQEWDAIGIHRRMHITCSDKLGRQESESVVCRPDGVWVSNLKCTFKGMFLYIYK